MRAEAATICPRPLQVDFLTLKAVPESRVTWPTSVPILVFLSLSICSRLRSDVRDRQTSDAHHRLMTPTLGRRRFRIDTEVRCVGAHPAFWPFEPARVKPKPVYDPDWPDGRLNLTASAFNQLYIYRSIYQQSWSQGLLLRRTRRFLPQVAVTIASTHCAYPRRDGQAELRNQTVYLPESSHPSQY